MVIPDRRGGRSPASVAASAAGPMVALAVAVPWLVDPGGVGYDHAIHRKVVAGWLDAWARGVPWPAYLDTPNSGLGSFWPSYYPPLYHALVAAGMAAGLDFWRSSMAVLLVGQVGGAAFCHAWLGRHSTRLGACLGSVAFAMAPYTVFNAYTRGAFPEGFAIAWLPAVFLGIDGVRGRWGWRAAAPGVVGFALIALGNLPALVVAGVATACYLAAGSLAGRGRGDLVRGTIVPALGLGLAAFSWLAAWLDAGSVGVPTGGSDLRTNPACRHYVYYGTFSRDPFDGMLYGIAYLLLATSLLLVACAGRGGPSRATGPALAACGLFFSGNSSSPFYLCLPLLHHAQFPWRFLGVMAPAVALLVASAARGPRAYSRAAAVLAVGAIGASDLALYRGSYATHLLDAPADDSGALTEFLPPGCAPPAAPGPIPRVEFVTGGGTAEVDRWAPGLRVISVRPSGPATVAVATYADPRWSAVDQDGRALETSRWDTPGRMAVALPPGTTRVRLDLIATDNALFARGLTLLCLVNLGAIAGVDRLFPRPGPGPPGGPG